MECSLGEFCPRAHSEVELRVQWLHTLLVDYYFVMFKFKKETYPFIEPHDPQICVYSHGPKDFRREITNQPYTNELCHFADQGGELACPNRWDCRGCHNYYELAFHPLIFKRIPCKHLNYQSPFCPLKHQNEPFLINELGKMTSFFLYISTDEWILTIPKEKSNITISLFLKCHMVLIHLFDLMAKLVFLHKDL